MDLFKKLDVAYIDQPYNTFVDLKTLVIDYNYFDQYKNQLIVVDFSSENHLHFENHVYDQLAKTDINFLLLTYNHEQHQKYPRMIYFPYWLVDSTSVNSSGIGDWRRHSNKITSKTYYLGCLNGASRPHRIVNFLKLRKKSYWDKISITFHNQDSRRRDDLRLTNDEINEWNKIKETLPSEVPPDSTDGISLNLPPLTDSYLHLVVETTISKYGIFITEKTWKPIAVGVPFVMFGNPGTMSFLKQQGVDIYDDIIDHKYYDTENSARSRLDKLHTVIDDLMAQGIDKIYNQLSDRVVANQTKFFNSEFSQSYLQTLTNTIEQYK